MTAKSEETGYFVDANTAEESERLRRQGQYLNEKMGLLPEVIPSPDSFPDFSVLDVGCASGGWLCDLAIQYRGKVRVNGIDVSENMLQAAGARAIRNKIDHAHFKKHDARAFPWPFPEASQRLIHARLIFAFMNRGMWPLLLAECSRLLCPGGYLVLTENDAQCWSTSPALAEYYRLGHLALYVQQQSWDKEGVGLVVRLPEMVRAQGLNVLSQDPYRIDIGKGTEGYKTAAKDHRSLYRDLQPFYLRSGVATQEELDVLYQQMVQEIAAEHFNGYWFFTRLTAQKPGKETS